MNPTTIIKEYLDKMEHCWNTLTDVPIGKRLDNSLKIVAEIDDLPLPPEGVYMFKSVLLDEMMRSKKHFLEIEKQCQKAGISGRDLSNILWEELKGLYK